MTLLELLLKELPKIGGWPSRHRLSTYPSEKLRELGLKHSVTVISDEITYWQGVDDVVTREQYEAALAAKNEGWIECGGECPVDGAIVDVKLRNGRAYSAQKALSTEGYASYPFWRNDGAGGDIIAYRLHKPQEAVHGEAGDEADLNECIDHDAAPVWSGEGLPPVGCFCEVEDLDGMLVYGKGESGEVIAHVENTAVIRMSYGLGCFEARFLRHIRTEAERKRDAAIEIMTQILCSQSQVSATAKKIYDAIAAGKIPGVKLED